MVHPPVLCSQSQQLALDTIRAQLDLSDNTLFKITETFLREAAEGLSTSGKPMGMLPTFVDSVPDGSETGIGLALDLGGTNLRVNKVTFRGDKTFESRKSEPVPVSEELKTGEATALFDHLAVSVGNFLNDPAVHSDIPSRSMTPLAFTFSFPVEQTALDSGKLLAWNKGYTVKNVVGKDVVRLLQDAFERKKVNVRCVALLNDTTGTLLSRGYTSGGCMLGAIFGTGTNGAYVEEVSKITKLENTPDGDHMIVNTEWGAFNNTRTVLPKTIYDNKLDRESVNPGTQAFEKFISGRYLGEIARNVILSLVDAAPELLLFGGNSTTSLNAQRGLDTKLLSDIEKAWHGDGKLGDEGRLSRVRNVIVEGLGFNDAAKVSLQDADVVGQICEIVMKRAARLSSCAVAAILVQTGHASLDGRDAPNPGALPEERKKIEVGVDGSLFEHNPRFGSMMREALRVLVTSEVEKRVDIGLVKDGSSAGAALCALIGQKQLTLRLMRAASQRV